MVYFDTVVKTETNTITPKAIYGRYDIADLLREIVGYVIIDFRPPKFGETFLNTYGRVEILKDIDIPRPRFILAKEQLEWEGEWFGDAGWKESKELI
jgi:hypothetical protein